MTDDPGRRRRSTESRKPRVPRFQPHTPLGEGGEFDVIRRLLERWGPRARRIGDDAAVITSLGERAVVVSIDTSVENVHFRREWLRPEEIGYRAAAAALSDLAAMGATPLGMLVAMAIPDSWRDSIDALADGIGDAAGVTHAPILGGDMSRATELSLTITVLGTAREVLSRASAHPGDRVYVTGRLGGSRAALLAFQSGGQPDPAHRERFARPVPRIAEAVWLAENGATAAIDISDGLAADAGHISHASCVRVVIDLDKVPVIDGVQPLEALRSGEEYEVLVTSPEQLDTESFGRRFGVELTEIGLVERGEHEVRVMRDGEQIEVPGGYLHFE